MSELMFYQAPAALNREQHRTLRFKPSDKFKFSREVNSVPLTGIEFFEASRDLPVLFSRGADGSYFPLALLSLRNNSHLLVDDEGAWRGSYIPAFIRRYPFALTDNQTVCFDRDSEHFSEEEGELLFDEQGENTQALNNIIQFLNQFDGAFKRTREFCLAVAGAELFKPFNIQILAGDNKPVRLEGLHVIDEAKLLEADRKQVYNWFKSGELAWIYAHLHSLGALKQLSKRQAENNAKEEVETSTVN